MRIEILGLGIRQIIFCCNTTDTIFQRRMNENRYQIRIVCQRVICTAANHNAGTFFGDLLDGIELCQKNLVVNAAYLQKQKKNSP